MQVIQHELDFPPAGSKELLGNPVVLMLRRIGADVIGIRGAVCRGGDRRGAIDAWLVKDFIARARMPAATALPAAIAAAQEL